MPILLRHLRIKFFLSSQSEVCLDSLIPIFHEWIREKRIPNRLLIDVADYRHVPEGPGVMLIADDAHYGLDSQGGEAGLLFSRRRDVLVDAETAMRQALMSAALATQLLESDPRVTNDLEFQTDSLEMSVLDRRIAPNSNETRLMIEPIWRKVLEEFSYQEVSFSFPSDSRDLFSLRMCSAQYAPSLQSLSK